MKASPVKPPLVFAGLAALPENPLLGYDRDFSLNLIERARGGSGEPWEHRCIAALLLENQLFRLAPGNWAEYDILLTELGLKTAIGLDCPLDRSVLQIGYTSADLKEFVPQLRCRLSRFERIHQRFNECPRSPDAAGDFLHLAKRECNLTLARYLLTADEVADRILQRLRTSRGLPDLIEPDHPFLQAESSRLLDRLPPYEARLLQRLLEGSPIFWTSETVESEINSLLEQPLGAVVVTVKPPGSHLELEIKRTGFRGQRPLSAAFSRDGCQLAKAHRLDGGSFGHLLRFEAGASSLLSLIYRLVHGGEAPIGRFAALRSIQTVPSQSGNRLLVEYFTDEGVFGEGFESMRRSLETAVEAFVREKGWAGPELDTPMGRTAQFLSFTGPGQAILAGTTSLRLDRLAAYLSPEGPRIYFREGLGIEPDLGQARRFAEEVLDEVLGLLTPPDVPYESHAQYVKAALDLPANRRRADAAFLSAFQETGRFWGTLLAVGGYSGGESFVARNVGLRNCWEEGRWRVRIIFMDHDNLNISGNLSSAFHPAKALEGMFLDWKAIQGGSLQGGWLPEERAGLQHLKGEAGYLEEIYQPSPTVKERGFAVFDSSLEEAFRKTREGLKSGPELRSLFPKTFVENLDDWDLTAQESLEVFSVSSADTGRRQALIQRWRERTKRRLAAKGYSEDLIREYTETASRHLPLLQQLWGVKGCALGK